MSYASHTPMKNNSASRVSEAEKDSNTSRSARHEMILLLMRYHMSTRPIISETNPPAKEKKMPRLRKLVAI